MVKKTAKTVAAEFNLTVYKLKSVLQYTLDHEFDLDKVDSTELLRTIKNLTGQNSLYPISQNIYDVLCEQKKELDKLETVEMVAVNNDIKTTSLQRFVNKMVKDGKALADGFLVRNIFYPSVKILIPKARIINVLNSYFINLLKSNSFEQMQLKTEGLRKTFYLLEEVQNDTTVLGRIIGFGRNAENRMTAIVACYNKQIVFFNKIKKYPSLKPHFFKKPLDNERSPIVFIFPLNEIQGYFNVTKTSLNNVDKSLREKFNVLLDALNGHSYQMKLLSATDESDYRIMLICNGFKIDYRHYIFDPKMDNKETFQQRFGKLQEQSFIKFLKDHLQNDATVTQDLNWPTTIIIRSNLSKVTLWISKDMHKALEQVAGKNGISVSFLFEDLMRLGKIDLRTSSYEDLIFSILAAARSQEGSDKDER